jgi:hypothetical protein
LNGSNAIDYLDGDRDGNAARFIDRLNIQRRGTRRERVLYHYLRRQNARDSLERRGTLAAAYLAQHAVSRPVALIDPRIGFASSLPPESEVLTAALAAARALFSALPDNAKLPNKGSRHFVVSGDSRRSFGSNQIDYGSALAVLGRSPLILLPVINYFGALPILYAVTVDRAPNDQDIANSSQLFHLDPEDITNMKIFIYVEDVDAETGPFTALPADKTALVVDALEYRKGRLRDEQVESVIGPGHETAFTGPAGTMVFCDTDRCLHYGGRRGLRRRDIISLHYVLPTATYYPFRPGDGEPSSEIPRLFSEDAPEIDKYLLGMIV